MTGHGADGVDGVDGQDGPGGGPGGGPGADGWDELNGGAAPLLEALAHVPELWVDQVGEVGRLRGARHLEQLVAQVVELLELTNAAIGFSPAERPLGAFLDACHDVRGRWSLDTGSGALELQDVTLTLPLLPLPGSDEDGQGGDRLVVRVRVPAPEQGAEPVGDVLVASLARPDALGIQHRGDVSLPALAVAVRDHLVDRLATATVLARAPEGAGVSPFPAIPADRDPDAAHAADRTLDLLAGFEHALARRAVAGRGPAGDAVGDAEVEHRRGIVLEDVEDVTVDVDQDLPAGTLQPVRLHFTARTGDDPDGLDVLPEKYTLHLDLVAGRRGVGVLEASTWSGHAYRSVLLPHVTDLWTDHLDAALRRCHAVVPAVRRRPIDDIRDPVPEVGPPVPESVWGKLRAGMDELLHELAKVSGTDVPF